MICLSGTKSVINCDFFPSIDLSQGEWSIGLVDFTTYNSIPNVERNVNNKIHFVNQDAIELPTGSYEIEDIDAYCQDRIRPPAQFKIRANNNTLKAEVYTTEEVDFTKESSIGPTLGFNKLLKPMDKWQESDLPVDIIKVNVIRIGCSIVRGTFDNGVESHTIYEFYPLVEPGFKIVEKPSNVIYLPVSVKQLSNITVTITDQEGRLINFRGETINVRLHLQQQHGTRLRLRT